MKQIPHTPGNPPGLLQKALALIVTSVLAILGLMFSVVLFSAMLVAAVAFGAYLWWKTRAVRQQMRQMQEAMQGFQAENANVERETFKGEIIEGEVIRVEKSGKDSTRPLQ